MRDSSELFDEYSSSYDSALSSALKVSGESREFFAVGRVAWLAERLAEMNFQPRVALDFGCGDGATSPLLHNILKLERVVGADVSSKSIESARTAQVPGAIEFTTLSAFEPSAQTDLVYCNGVFHHIPPAERMANLQTIRAALRTGGLFAFWENNPWNPATHYVMAHCAFDRDAQMLSPVAARQLLVQAGFEVIRTDFLFIFPRSLKFLRGLERSLSALPLGTQYQVLCRKKG